MRHISLIASALVVLALNSPSFAQEDDFEMAPPNAGGLEQVLGGIPQDVNDWPATLVFTSKGGLCTSTVVGKRAVLTAAHCIPDGAKGRIRLGAGTANVVCTHHTRYAEDYQLDIAMCLADADIVLTRGTRKFETLNQSGGKPRIDASIMLLGYGCTVKKGDNPNKILYGGRAPVNRFSGYYIVTVGSHAVCFGDSGGAAYLETETSRSIVGVNSRGDIIQRSLLTNVASSPVSEFIQWWMDKNNVDVCGMDEDEDSNCL